MKLTSIIPRLRSRWIDGAERRRRRRARRAEDLWRAGKGLHDARGPIPAFPGPGGAFTIPGRWLLTAAA